MENICSICDNSLSSDVNSTIGTGDGTGNSFAHGYCYWQQESKRLAEMLASQLLFTSHLVSCNVNMPFSEDMDCDCGFPDLRDEVRKVINYYNINPLLVGM